MMTVTGYDRKDEDCAADIDDGDRNNISPVPMIVLNCPLATKVTELSTCITRKSYEQGSIRYQHVVGRVHHRSESESGGTVG